MFDLMLAENGADAPNHSRHVFVADGEQRPLQRGFNVDAVKVQQPRRVAMQYGAAGGDAGFVRMQRQLQHAAGSAERRFLLLLVQANAALRGDGSGVNAVRPAQDGPERRQWRSCGSARSSVSASAAMISDLNAVNAPAGNLGEERAEPLGQGHLRREFLVLLVAERGKVNSVLRHAGLKILADLHARSARQQLPALRRSNPRCAA